MNALVNWRRALWRMPILLGALTWVGLLAGLVGDGPWDVLSWFGLGVPAVIGVWFALGRGRRAAHAEGSNRSTQPQRKSAKSS